MFRILSNSSLKLSPCVKYNENDKKGEFKTTEACEIRWDSKWEGRYVLHGVYSEK
jgi:hypothetical protein